MPRQDLLGPQGNNLALLLLNLEGLPLVAMLPLGLDGNSITWGNLEKHKEEDDG